MYIKDIAFGAESGINSGWLVEEIPVRRK
jgi:hypothetical protein